MTVPVTQAQLCGAWLVVIHELTYRDESGSAQPAWTYAHSDRLSLAELTGAALGCSSR